MSDKCDCGHGQHVHVGYTDGCGLCDTCMGFRITPTARVEAERAIADVLAGHRVVAGRVTDNVADPVRYVCKCGEVVGDHGTHLASVLADLMAERQAEAWDEAYHTGIHDERMSQEFDGGMTPPARVNPYPKDTRDE